MKKLDNIDMPKLVKFVALLLISLCAIGLFIGMISAYLNKFEKALLAETSNYLSEIANHITTNMQMVVSDTQTALKTAAITFPVLEGQEKELAFLNLLQQQYHLAYVTYQDREGNTLSTMNWAPKEVHTQAHYQRALQGKNVIEYIPRIIFKDRAISGILIAVPVYGNTAPNSQPTGALLAVLDINSLNEILSVESFNGMGYTYIIDTTGEIVLHTKRMDYSNLYMALRNTEFEEGYSVETLIDDITAQRQGFAIYSDFGIEKYMYYKYLGIDSWSVVTVVEKNVVTAKTTKLTKELTAIAIGIMILCPILLITTVLTYGLSKNRKQAADAKTAFLANMSHEIRTPMNAIIGISEILLRENITGKQKNFVLSIVNAGNGLLTIINDILDISKIESGKFNIVDEEYELESLIYDLTTIIAIKIGDKPIEFMIDLDPKLPKYLTGDMIRVKQVLLNIIGNAVKFTQRGSIKLGIYLQTINGKTQLVMPITDTGIGILKKDLDRLFTSFTQVDTHKNHHLEGTGLGLVISKRLCEMMGGGIVVESEYGKGSTFTIMVQQKVTRQERLLHITKTDGFRILLLEPAPILAEYYQGCLEKMNLRYHICTTQDELQIELKMPGYTHVLARSQAYQQLTDAELHQTNARLVSILNLNDPTLGEENRLNVYVPLFTMQLSAVLCNRTDRPQLLQRSGIDLLTIQPLPFVKILLVDDNEVNLQVANGLMHPYHMQVDCALSGKKAIAMLAQTHYDLIFMDHMMPEMDGVEAVKIIRGLSDSVKKQVPIVALTANITHDARDLFIESGFDDFLAKPIETIKLNSILKKWLKDSNQARAELNPQAVKEFQKKLQEDQQKIKATNFKGENGNTPFVSFSLGREKLGNDQVYCSILATYCRTANEKLQELPTLLETDLKNFTVEIHGLKGASSGIYANPVAQQAAQLEELAKESQTMLIKEKLPNFLMELKQTIKDIEIYIKNHSYNPAQEAAPPKKISRRGSLTAELLGNLETAFLDFNTEALADLFQEQQKFVYNQPEADLLQKLQEYYLAYDFEAPLGLLQAYKQAVQERMETR